MHPFLLLRSQARPTRWPALTETDTRAAPPTVWQVVDLPAPEGPLDQPTEELIARIQAELDEAARA